MLAWYEQGGIYAIAHVRGGGEYGEAWHQAGLKARKQNTISDFIACAEYLIARGYTSPQFLAGEGKSAGTIPCVCAMIQKPHLWAAIILHAPLTNTLRFELTASGPPNSAEFGTVTTEEGFQSLLAIDSYTQIQTGVSYPAVMVYIGLYDSRVEPWQAMKFVARLQAATSADNPILLRVDPKGGHDIGWTKQQLSEKRADTFAFLWQQYGFL